MAWKNIWSCVTDFLNRAQYTRDDARCMLHMSKGEQHILITSGPNANASIVLQEQLLKIKKLDSNAAKLGLEKYEIDGVPKRFLWRTTDSRNYTNSSFFFSKLMHAFDQLIVVVRNRLHEGDGYIMQAAKNYFENPGDMIIVRTDAEKALEDKIKTALHRGLKVDTQQLLAQIQDDTIEGLKRDLAMEPLPEVMFINSRQMLPYQRGKYKPQPHEKMAADVKMDEEKLRKYILGDGMEVQQNTNPIGNPPPKEILRD